MYLPCIRSGEGAAYEADRNRKVNPRLTELDPILDRTIGAISRIASEAAATLVNTTQGEHGQLVVEKALPNGASGITSKSYVEQTTETTNIIALFKGELAPMIDSLGLGIYVDQLETLNNEFREILAAGPREGVTTDEVRAANELGQNNLVQAVVMILGTYPSSSEEDLVARKEFLAPISRQNKLIYEYLRRRRVVADVNPDTGELSEEPEVGPTSENPPVPPA